MLNFVTRFYNLSLLYTNSFLERILNRNGNWIFLVGIIFVYCYFAGLDAFIVAFAISFGIGPGSGSKSLLPLLFMPFWVYSYRNSLPLSRKRGYYTEYDYNQNKKKGARRFISSSSNFSTKRNKKPLVIKGSSTFMFYFYIIIFPIIFVFILALFKALLLDTVFWNSISPYVNYTATILINISILIVIWWFFLNLIKYMLYRFFYINKQFILYKFKPLYLYKKIKLIYDDCHDDENEKELLELINMFRISGLRCLILFIFLVPMCIYF